MGTLPPVNASRAERRRSHANHLASDPVHVCTDRRGVRAWVGKARLPPARRPRFSLPSVKGENREHQTYNLAFNLCQRSWFADKCCCGRRATKIRHRCDLSGLGFLGKTVECPPDEQAGPDQLPKP